MKFQLKKTWNKLKPDMKPGARAVSFTLFALCALLLITSVTGYVLRGTGKADACLDRMGTSAVLNAASGGLVDTIAADAKADKLKELRKQSDFRQMGTGKVTRLCEEAEAEARKEAEAKYGNTENVDTTRVESLTADLKAALHVYNLALEKEQNAYADLYEKLISSVSDWNAFIAVGIAPEAEAPEAEAEDAAQEPIPFDGDGAIWDAMCEKVPELNQKQWLKDSFVKLAKDMAAEQTKQLEAQTNVSETAAEEETVEEEQTVDMSYFVASSDMDVLEDKVDEAYDQLWAELVNITPDLKTLNKKNRDSIRETIQDVVAASYEDFETRYSAYAGQNAEQILDGFDRVYMKLASLAEIILIAFIALLLFAILYTWWKPITSNMGVPRTIILLFFIYLCLASRLFGMNVSAMFGNVLERVGMYGILVLAMLPSIQCGIGLNMGMTIGCVSGLFAIIVTLQLNMTGYEALIVGCVLGALVALPLGWAYSLLLNRMKGSEMTISTYVGYSFVSLMCIVWLLLPFYNPRIVFPLRGSGMRVTHSLLGVTAHLLDDLGKFKILGVSIPTGILVFFLLMCLIMWLFSRSKLGVAMSAVGSNPRFAEASGINVDHMRTLGTILSMVIAAIGIVVYSSAFGYAQLYNAPKQLGFITASAILIGGASVSKGKVSHVIIGVFLFEGVLTLGQQVANAAVAGGGLSEVMRIMISNGIILYALTQSGGDSRG